MSWKKLGLLFAPDKNLYWQQSHAQNPFPIQIDDHIFRIFYASRDKGNTSRTGYFDLDMRDPFAPKNYSKEPLLDVGPLGAFDDSGAMPHSILKMGEEYMLYYTGWSLGMTVPFTFYIGAAKAASLDGPYQKVSLAPILGRSFFDPYLTAAPSVIKVDNYFLMYYVSGLRWEKEASGNLKHYYTIKYAVSPDGLNWSPNPNVVIPLEGDEYAIARPVIFKDKENYELWFSYRGGNNTYRIGLATSKDLASWKRAEVDLEPGKDGEWDSGMVCYAHPFYYNGDKYLLYNGNAYGATGVGLARLE
jgi:predicted GH43/DUF377 family glycosyl hydrolase